MFKTTDHHVSCSTASSEPPETTFAAMHCGRHDTATQQSREKRSCFLRAWRHCIPFLMWSDETNFTGRVLLDFSALVRAYRATCQAQTTQRMDQFFQWWVVSLAPRCNRHSRDMQRSMSLASLSRSFKYLQTLVSIPCAVLFYRIPQHRQRISKKNRFSIRFLSGFMLCFYLSLRFALIALREPLEKRLPPLSWCSRQDVHISHIACEQAQLCATSAR